MVQTGLLQEVSSGAVTVAGEASELQALPQVAALLWGSVPGRRRRAHDSGDGGSSGRGARAPGRASPHPRDARRLRGGRGSRGCGLPAGRGPWVDRPGGRGVREPCPERRAGPPRRSVATRGPGLLARRGPAGPAAPLDARAELALFARGAGIMIGHSLGTARLPERILVLEGGRAVVRLMASDGAAARGRRRGRVAAGGDANAVEIGPEGPWSKACRPRQAAWQGRAGRRPAPPKRPQRGGPLAPVENTLAHGHPLRPIPATATARPSCGISAARCRARGVAGESAGGTWCGRHPSASSPRSRGSCGPLWRSAAPRWTSALCRARRTSIGARRMSCGGPPEPLSPLRPAIGCRSTTWRRPRGWT